MLPVHCSVVTAQWRWACFSLCELQLQSHLGTGTVWELQPVKPCRKDRCALAQRHVFICPFSSFFLPSRWKTGDVSSPLPHVCLPPLHLSSQSRFVHHQRHRVPLFRSPTAPPSNSSARAAFQYTGHHLGRLPRPIHHGDRFSFRCCFTFIFEIISFSRHCSC